MTEMSSISGYPAPEDDTIILTISELEAWAIERAIRICNGRVTEAARKLGIGRSTLYRKVDEYRIDVAEIKAAKMKHPA